jgi:glutathione S-transferase
MAYFAKRASVMPILYDYLPSQNAWKIRLLLNQLDQPYTQQFVSIFEGEGQQEEFLSLNPMGAVPVLKLDDGAVIAESNAILMYLARDTPFLPSNIVLQAQVLQWLFFEADYVQSSVATLRHWVLTGKDQNRSKDMLQNKRDASQRVLATLNKRLCDNLFLAGQKYSIADISVFAYVHLSEDAGVSLDDYGNVLRWIDTVKAQPRFLDEVYPYSIDEYSVREL